MLRKVSFALVVLILLFTVAGCTPIAPQPRPTIRFGVTQEADISLVPVLMALEAMEAKGYPVEITYYAETSLNVEALASGQSDFAVGSPAGYWAAIQQGAEIATLMEYVRNPWVLSVADGIETCDDLQGKRLAVTGEGSSHTTMLRTYLAENCPETEYELLYIQGGDNRAAAMLQGELDGAALEHADVDALNRESDAFHTMATFADELPDLLTSGLYVNKAFANEWEAVPEDFITELLDVHRKITADPDLFVTEAARLLEMSADDIRPLAETLIAGDNWPVDGGLNEAKLQYSLDYYTDAGELEAGMTIGDVADLSHLQAALNGE